MATSASRLEALRRLAAGHCSVVILRSCCVDVVLRLCPAWSRRESEAVRATGTIPLGAVGALGPAPTLVGVFGCHTASVLENFMGWEEVGAPSRVRFRVVLSGSKIQCALHPSRPCLAGTPGILAPPASAPQSLQARCHLRPVPLGAPCSLTVLISGDSARGERRDRCCWWRLRNDKPSSCLHPPWVSWGSHWCAPFPG